MLVPNPSKSKEISRRQKMKWLTYLGAITVILLALLIPLYITSQPSFYARQKSLKPRYETWRASSHKKVACIQCHIEPGVTATIVNRTGNIKNFYLSLVFRSKKTEKLRKATSQACLNCHLKKTIIKSDTRVPVIPHQIHNSSVTTQKDCLQCHKWLVHDEKFQDKHKSLPLTGVCFKYGCHGEVKPIEECQSCHHRESISNIDWRRQHREVVNARGANRCFDYCHEANWCRNCHITGKKEPVPGTTTITIQASSTLISRHTGKDWLKFHGEEALVNSKRCLACHANYQLCENCHSIRPNSHGRKETWLAQHKKPAKQKEQGCLTCHQKKVCDQCHELFKDVGR